MFTLLMIIAALAAGSGVYYLFREPPSEEIEKSEAGNESKTTEDLKFPRGSEIKVLPYNYKEELREAEPTEKQKPDPNRKVKEGNLKKKKLKLTYDTDEIITKNSRYSFHRRPLLNAELLVEKENYESALEILTRTEARIPDAEIKKKIATNADDIRNFLKDDGDELSLEDGKYSKVEIPFGDLVRAIKEITEGLAETVSRGVSIPLVYPVDPNLPSGSGLSDKLESISQEIDSGSHKIVAIPMILDGGGLANLLKDNSSQAAKESDLGKFFPQNSPPIIYQIFQGSKDAGSPFEPLAKGIEKKDDFPFESDEKEERGTGKEEQAKKEDQQSQSLPFEKQEGRFPEQGFQTYPQRAQTPFNQFAESQLEEALSPKPKVEEPSDAILESAVFDSNWEKFQNLPIKDRRSGIERRKVNERRGDFTRKDRRSGEDRRKVDLFKERDEFLKKKADEKKEDDLFNLQQQRMSDVLPPLQFPSPFGIPSFEEIPILLPDPEEREINLLPDPKELHFFPEPTQNELGLSNPATEYSPSFAIDNLYPIDLPIPKDISLSPPASNLGETSLPRPSNRDFEDRDLDFSNEYKDDLVSKISLPDPVDLEKEPEKEVEATPLPQIPVGDEDKEVPEVEVVEGNLDELEPPPEEPKAEPEPERTIHGILELKPPEVDDAPFLTLTYDFGKIPHAFRLSKNHTVMEYSYYKYKPMLLKAQEFARRKMLKNALNYYRVIKSQNIPPELKRMVNRNITDITEFMEKYLMAKG